MATDRSREMRLRRWARKIDHQLYKDRARVPGTLNRGAYMLIDKEAASIVLGALFEASLDDVEGYLRARQKEMRA